MDFATETDLKNIKTYFYENKFNYDQSVFNLKGDIYFAGYWHTARYFKDIEGEIRKDFEFCNPLDSRNLKILEQIKRKNAVSLHIRRGDYINKLAAAKLHGGICTFQYYLQAVNMIKKLIPEPVFFIFSDQIEWVKRNFKLHCNRFFVDLNRGYDSYKDLQLMSLCRHNIIANSSFSWWGAWLNKNKSKVVLAPAKWFNDQRLNTQDVIPENWIKVKR